MKPINLRRAIKRGKPSEFDKWAIEQLRQPSDPTPTAGDLKKAGKLLDLLENLRKFPFLTPDLIPVIAREFATQRSQLLSEVGKLEDFYKEMCDLIAGMSSGQELAKIYREALENWEEFKSKIGGNAE